MAPQRLHKRVGVLVLRLDWDLCDRHLPSRPCRPRRGQSQPLRPAEWWDLGRRGKLTPNVRSAAALLWIVAHQCPSPTHPHQRDVAIPIQLDGSRKYSDRPRPDCCQIRFLRIARSCPASTSLPWNRTRLWSFLTTFHLPSQVRKWCFPTGL